MPFNPIPDVVMVTTRWTWSAEEFINVWYVDHPSPGVPLTLAQAEAIGGFWDVFFFTTPGGGTFAVNEYIPNEATFDRILIRDMVSESRPQFELERSNPGEGTQLTLPPQVSATVKLKTDVATRNFTGSKRIGPLTVLAMDAQSGATNTEFRNNLTLAFMELIAGLDAAGTELLVVSQYDGTDPVTGKPARRPVPLTQPVTQAIVRQYFGGTESRRSALKG